jgi:hypothetical protein
MPAKKETKLKKNGVEKLYANPLGKKAKSKDDEQTTLRTARERHRDGSTFWSDNWKRAENDIIFLSGEQWPDQVRTERENSDRPCLTNNVLPTFVDQVLGDQRQNKPSIKISMSEAMMVQNKEGEVEELKIGNLTGKQEYSAAEAMQGIIRNIEYNCDAEDAYDLAFQASVESGLGYLRVRNDYSTDESFEQDLLIEAIEDQFSVVIDPDAQKLLKEDMNWAFIDTNINKKAFKRLYPDAAMDSISDEIGSAGSGTAESWFAEKTVRVSEYYQREQVTREKALLSDGSSMWMDEIEPIVDELLEKGVEIKRTRKIKTHKVTWMKISGSSILEGPFEVPGSTIPIVPVYGKSHRLRNKKTFRGLIRYAKDGQRMANYWDSAATESVALAPKAPFIAQAEHIEGHEEWKTANTVNHSVLTYTPTSPGDRGPMRSQPAAVPSAELTLGMGATDKIKATLGMFDASIGNRGNETSGKAIIARQRESDVGSFAFIDNLSKAIRRVGRLLVELIPVVYDTERTLRIKLPDETEDFVRINQQIFDEESGKWVKVYDLGLGKYDVVVSTGPAYSTQRQEAAESMIQFAQAVPSAAAVMSDLIAQNMDWPGADVIAARLKKIVPPNVLTQEEREANEEDAPEQNPEASPEQQAQMAEAQADMAVSEAKVAKAEADKVIAEQRTIQAELETEQAQIALANVRAGAEAGVPGFEEIRHMIAEAVAAVAEG